MCGIVGVINKKAKKGLTGTANADLNNTFDNMLWADQLRGLDGTGVMKMNQHLQVEWLKNEGPYRSLATLNDWYKFKSWVDASFFTVGHNRSATKGIVNADNAHPFESKHITLVHNGTLRSFPKKFQHVDPKFDVDSLALTRMIDELGIEKAVDEFTGAYACVWLDDKDKSINIARNIERPLGMVILESAILIASEPFMAAWCAQRNNLKVLDFKPFEVHTHYKMFAEDMSEFVETKYEPKTKKTYTGYGAYSPWDVDTDDEDAEDFFNKGTANTKVKHTDITPNKSKDSSSKDSPKRTKSKDKFHAVASIRGDGDCDYHVGAKVAVQLSGIKTTQRVDHYQFDGIINEAATIDIRHKVIGTTALPYKEISNFDLVYEAEISAIMKSQTGFYLINVKNLRIASDVEEETGGDSPVENSKSSPITSNVPLLPVSVKVANYTGDSIQCEACEVFLPKEEISTITSTTETPGKGYRVMRNLHVCESCADEIVDNFANFDKIFSKKLQRLRMVQAAKAV